MSYTPTEWQAGDVVTAEKLNKLENGLACGALLVNSLFRDQSFDRYLDKTYGEIRDAIISGRTVIVKIDAEREYSQTNTFRYINAITLIENPTNNMYEVDVYDNHKYTTNTLDGYPEYLSD